MLEFVKTFDLLGSIRQFLQERRQSIGLSDGAALHPRVINQERGGVIIYTWNDRSEDLKVARPVTHVGIYDPFSQKHRVLWVYNQKVKIVSCSLNKERTLLGFTTITRQEAGPDGKTKDVYQAFLAELQSLDPRVFSLNLQRQSHIKLQFLYPDVTSTPSTGSTPSRHSHMIVMLHKESIGLYQIPMARIGDRGIMMSGQPSTEQIVRKFVWCQWDAASQRLYYIHNVRLSSSSHADMVVHKLSTIQFHSGVKFDNMIDVPINFPFPYIRTSTRSCYIDIPLYQSIPDALLNTVVLSQPNGSLCLCYQEYVSSSPRHRGPPLSTIARTEEDGDGTLVDVNYYVCMVHHAKTLHGTATGLPRSLLAGRRAHFQWFGDYLAVVMPGVFCHLLNVNLDYEPCHHILLHNHGIPALTQPAAPTSGESSQATSQASRSSASTSASPSTSNSTDAMSEQERLVTAVQAHALVRGSMQTSQGQGSDPLPSDEGAIRVEEGPGVSRGPTSPQSLTVNVSGVGGALIASVSLLNLTASPRHHSGADVPDVVSVVDGDCIRLGMLLYPCFGFSRETGLAGPNVYDARSGCVWRLASNPDAVVSSFGTAYWSTQLAILHYLVLQRQRDMHTIRRVLETLTADPTAPETTIFLSEFLVASTFASMRKKSDKETTQLLTFTMSDTFRGQFEKNSNGERLARMTYISLDSVNISTKASRERRRRSSEDSWDLLRRSLRLKQMPPPSRFSHEHVLKALEKDIDMNGSPARKWSWVNQELGQSFFDGMHTVKLTDVPTLSVTCGRNPESSPSSDSSGREGGHRRTESVLGATPLFLQVNQFVKSETKKTISSVTEQLLVAHLFRHLKKESRIKAQNIAREYINCQIQQSQLLCHLLWSIHTNEETTAYERLLPRLNECGTDGDYLLFQVYERVFLVTQDLAYPRPPGFSSYFTSLGFRCLTFSLFLQYVDRGILQLTPDFILQLMEDLSDEEEGNAETKFHIISRLPKPFAEDCFRRWRHPLTRQSEARQQVAHVLQEGTMMTLAKRTTDADCRNRNVRSSSMNSSDSQNVASAGSLSFKPLAIFIRHLEDTAMEVQRLRPGSASLMYDTAVIEEAALFHTSNSSSYDLSTLNF